MIARLTGQGPRRVAGCLQVAGTALVILAALAPAPATATSIADTVHNLTPTGPGTFKAPEPTGLCVYCHTPHNASPQGALWNKEVSGATYQLYESTTLKAQVQQPTGSSRLCLACHDGTLAMGTLRASQNGLQPTLGVLTGRSVIGTNLSGDHPISFVYDSGLAANRGELVDPLSVPATLKLDKNSELQCTSCHDAHEDRRPSFLRMDTRAGALCLTCHKPLGWNGTTHATSQAAWTGAGPNPWPNSGFTTVSDNGCENCHRPHAAAHGQSLLAQGSEVANCSICHSGSVATPNIQNEFLKPSRHPIDNAEWTHTPKEDPMSMPRHVTCADCHNAHASNANPANGPGVSGRLQGARGLNQSGATVAAASAEYEVCYKCHGLSAATSGGIQRQDNTRNARLQFDPVNPSYHPVAAVGKNTSIEILEPGYSATSRISCTSCHNNDAWISGGSNPAGPHGSIYQPILASDYNTDETVIESPTNFGLCYSCHARSVFLVDMPGKFPHARHLNKQTSCAACHDAHGSRQYPHLINFMLADRNGVQVVTPSTAQGRLDYVPLGNGGQCYLNCHGVNHEPSTYP